MFGFEGNKKHFIRVKPERNVAANIKNANRVPYEQACEEFQPSSKNIMTPCTLVHQHTFPCFGFQRFIVVMAGSQAEQSWSRVRRGRFILAQMWVQLWLRPALHRPAGAKDF